MTNRLTIFCAYISILLIFSCDDSRLNFDKAIIPLQPVNFSQVNSIYDDYNSTIDFIWRIEHFSLVFSTNRASKGKDFNFIVYDCNLFADLVNGVINIDVSLMNDPLTEEINSLYNELGPFMTNDMGDYYSGETSYDENRFFYTSDKNGNLDIFVNYYTIDYEGMHREGNTIELTGLNTGYDEGYITIHRNSVPNREKIYFTSNQDNQFDIYQAISEENKLIDQSENMVVEKVNRLSSDFNDKCPFVSGNVMVFASDRDGGYGGFDLWYAEYDGEEWSLPKNFGEQINTEYDEYRPVILQTNKEDFFNDLMIFSSNRPGGAGMFDLYYVGLGKSFN